LARYSFGVIGVASGYPVDEFVFMLREIRWWVACIGGSLVVDYLASTAFMHAWLGDRLSLMTIMASCGFRSYVRLGLMADLA